MFRALLFKGSIVIIRLIHLPSLSESIVFEDYKGAELIPPNGNAKEFLRQIIEEHRLNVSLRKENGTEKTTNELGKEIIKNL